jgi:hypothetical protein
MPAIDLSNSTKPVPASTRTLFEVSYKEELEPAPQAPIPVKTITEYTEVRLKKCLYFADHTLRNKRRQITPRVFHCFTLYKATLRAMLEKEYTAERERLGLLCTLRLFENDIHAQSFLRPTVDTKVLLVQRLSQLRRYEIAARYGDYFPRICKDLKIDTEPEQTQHFKQSVGWERYWSHINKEIESESLLWERWLVRDPGVPNDHVRTTLAIYHAAHAMGIDYGRALQTISLYSDHDSLVHASVAKLVEDANWLAIQNDLARDIVDLPLVTPPQLRDNIPVIQMTMFAVLDTYFVRPEEYQDEPIFWGPKKKSLKEAKALKEQGKKKDLAHLKQEREEVEKHAIERLRKLVREAARPERATIHKRQNVAWVKLVNCRRKRWCEVIGKDECIDTNTPIGPEVWLNLALGDEPGEEEERGSYC